MPNQENYFTIQVVKKTNQFLIIHTMDILEKLIMIKWNKKIKINKILKRNRRKRLKKIKIAIVNDPKNDY